MDLFLGSREGDVQSVPRPLSEWPGRAVPALVCAVVVFGASVVNPPSSGLTPTGPLGLVGVDKWLHVGGYAVLASVVGYALWVRAARPLVLAVVIVSVYGAGLEGVQSLLPLRSFDLLDMLANALGACLAALVLSTVSSWLEHREGGAVDRRR